MVCEQMEKRILDINLETISESIDMTKPELKRMMKDVFDDEFKKEAKKMIDSEDVRDMVRKMLKKQYRTFWEKSALFLDRL